MFRKKIIFAVLFLATAGLACSININLPSIEVKTGPTVTDEINVSEIDAEDVDITLSMGAGELTLNPGAENAVIDGTATYNVEDFKPEIKIEGNKVTIEQGNLNIEGIPKFDKDVENHWDLALGNQLMTLRIKAGAYVGKYDLGGLELQNLYVEDGAADVKLTFSEPNQAEMGILDYQTGASNITLTNLANANFATLVFRSGAGNYVLDFSGELQRDANVKIESGLSSVKIIVPKGTPAKVTFDGGLTNVSISGDWNKSGDTYTQSGEGPALTITVDMGAGNLELANSP